MSRLTTQLTFQIAGMRGPAGTVTTDLTALEANVVAKAAQTQAAANQIEGAADTIDALSPLATITTTTAGPALAAGTNITANTSTFNSYLFPAGTLTRLEAYVAALGNGTIEFDIATFSGLSGFTRKRITLAVSSSNEGAGATGAKSWSQAAIEAAAGGPVEIVANSQIGVFLSTGGAVVPRVAGAGFVYATGAPTAGAARNYAQFNTGSSTAFDVAIRAAVKSSVVAVGAEYLDAEITAGVELANRAITDKTAVYGPAPLAGGAAIAATTALFSADASHTVTAAGPMGGFSAQVQSVGNGNLMLLIATRSGLSFTTYKKLTLALSASVGGAVTGTAVWTQAAIEAANGGPLNLNVGDDVGLYMISGGVSVANVAGGSNIAYRAGEPVVGTAYTYSPTSGTAQFNFTIEGTEVSTTHLDATARTGIAEASRSAKIRRRRVLLSDTVFTAADDVAWTKVGTWTQAAGGWQSPASPTAYTTALKFGTFNSNLRKRSIEWEFAPAGTGAVALFAWECAIQFECSAVTVDWAAGLLRMKKAMGTQAAPIGASGDGYTSDPGDFATAAIPAAVAGRKYRVVMTIDDRTNTYELWDTVSGAKLATVQDAVSGLNTSNFVTGAQFGSPVCKPLAGQITVGRARIIANCRPGVELMIIGDSETDGQGIPVADVFATLVGEEVGDYVVSARPGEYSTVVADLWNSEVSRIKPKRVILFLGINGQTINQPAYNTFIANCQAQGTEVAVCLVPPTGYGFAPSSTNWAVPTAANNYLLSLPPSVVKIRLDLAMSVNNDGVTGVEDYVQRIDRLHFTKAAGPVIQARVRFDFDTLVQPS